MPPSSEPLLHPIALVESLATAVTVIVPALAEAAAFSISFVLALTEALPFPLLSGLAISMPGHIHGALLLFFLVVRDIETHRLPVIQALETIRVDVGEVDEQLLTALVGHNETETLTRVEEFNRALTRHCFGVMGIYFQQVNAPSEQF